MTTLKRRTFLSAGAAAALGTVSGIAQAKSFDPMPAQWDENFDVIVIGSGFAGLAAACEAKNQGGNSVINGGIMSVPGSAFQKTLGIKDSPELLAEDMIREGLGYNYPEKVSAMTKAALPTYE